MIAKVIFAGKAKQLQPPSNHFALLHLIRDNFAIDFDLTLTYHDEGNSQLMELDNDEHWQVIIAHNRNIVIFAEKRQGSFLMPIGHKPEAQSDFQSPNQTFQEQTKELAKHEQGEIVPKQAQGKVSVRQYEGCSKKKHQQYIHEGIACSQCKIQPIIGNRWKCQICPLYNLCNACYKRKSKSGTHKQLEHSFYKIKNELFFKAINYRDLMQLFFLPTQPPGKQTQWMSLDDFQNEGEQFQKEMAHWKSCYSELLDSNIEAWEKQFLSLKKK